MIRTFAHYTLEKFAKSLKGSNFFIDRDIPLSSIIEIGFRRFIYLLRAASKGFPPRRRIFIGKDVKLRARHLIKIGRGVTLGNGVLIDGLSLNGIRIGDHVSIGDHTRLEASGTITDIGLGIDIGDNCGIGAYSFVGGSGGVKIGSDVIMGQWVSFHPENHNFSQFDAPIRLQGVNRKGITVEDDCWIGAKVTFLDGAHVCKGCVIAAGSVVRGFIPPHSIVAGVPARVIKSRKQETAS